MGSTRGSMKMLRIMMRVGCELCWRLVGGLILLVAVGVVCWLVFIICGWLYDMVRFNIS